MSKSVTFSFSNSAPFPAKSAPTHSSVSTAVKPTTMKIKSSEPTPSNYVKIETQSAPQVQKERIELAVTPSHALNGDNSSSTAGFVERQVQMKPSSSVQAETGQLKMENGTHSMPVGFRGTIKHFEKKSQPAPAEKIKSHSPPVNACTIAEKMRQQFNHQIHEHVQSVNCEQATLHEHLIKLEDEIKLANKGKSALEKAINDIRKGMSVNQQSISAQQKKRRDEDSKSEVFFKEAKILSNLKRELDSHFHMIKQHLHILDTLRKQLQNKISTLSKSSDLSAHRFKVYSGPVQMNRLEDGRPHHYNTGLHLPLHSHHREILPIILENIRTSRNMRAGIKDLVASAHSTKIQAHEKVAAAMLQSVQKLKNQQRDLCLEKGKLRLQQNAALHEAHKADIALGIVCGPISEKYKGVALSDDRPLTRSRPASAMEETQSIKSAKTSLKRQVSAAESRRSSIASVDQRLSHSLVESCRNTSVDSQIIRARKMSLDNKWVT